MSSQKQRGSSWERAIVDYLRSFGFAYVERRIAGSVKDRGDIAGLPGIVIEAKSCARIDLATFVDEAVLEGVNDKAWLAVTWIKRRGKSSAGDGYVVLTGRQFIEILREVANGAITAPQQTPAPGVNGTSGTPMVDQHDPDGVRVSFARPGPVETSARARAQPRDRT